MDIFICYRRADTQHISRLIAERLENAFGADSVFIDYKIPAGEDFVEFIDNRLKSTDIFIVVIGAKWLDIVDKHGNLRLYNAGDHVRKEVATALSREGVRVVPVRVDGAQHPSQEQLPQDLEKLATRNSLELLDDNYFDISIQTLIDGLNKWKTKVEGSTTPAQPDRLPGSPNMTPYVAPLDGAAPPSVSRENPGSRRERRERSTSIAALVVTLVLIVAIIGFSPQIFSAFGVGATPTPTSTPTSTPTPTATFSPVPTETATATPESSVTPTTTETATSTASATVTPTRTTAPFIPQVPTVIPTTATAVSTPFPCAMNDGVCNSLCSVDSTSVENSFDCG